MEMKKVKSTNKQIAEAIGVCKRTLYYELARRKCEQMTTGLEIVERYCPDVAERKYQEHLREKGPDLKLGNDHKFANKVEELIVDKSFSPAAALQAIEADEEEYDTHESMNLILPPLRRLLARERPTGAQLILRSDQGTQFASANYSYLLEQNNVTQSMSRVATPRDNAVIESVFGWFKEFLRSDYFPRATVPIRELLEKAVYDFNHSRPSYKLNYMTPVQFRIEQGFL